MSSLEIVLVNGARCLIDLPVGSGTMANALARLDDWIQTADGGWVQKRHIVEVRPIDAEAPDTAGGTSAN